jgi:transcriptional regulator with XRE-family HTH domain
LCDGHSCPSPDPRPPAKPHKTRQIHFLTNIAYCNIVIAICYMTLAEKIRYLREVEGSLRELDRPMTQQELLKAIKAETGGSISQSYLSQIEGGKRPHMTQSTRTLLAKFFKVHPGFLVDDPDGYHTELTSDLRATEGQLDVWLLQGSERFAADHEVSEVLIKLAREKNTRGCILLLGEILNTPGLSDRLFEALRPETAAEAARRQSRDPAANRPKSRPALAAAEERTRRRT